MINEIEALQAFAPVYGLPSWQVLISADRLVRTRKKLAGKDDVQTIPIKSITGVHHDRKTLGTDLVKLDVGSVSYEWKVSNAERMVAALHSRMF